LSAQELEMLYAPTEEERDFVATHAWNATQQLTLVTLLKCHQSWAICRLRHDPL